MAISGRARVGRRTKDLIKLLEAGDIAVIDHADLDRVAGDGLAESGVAAVVNAAPSITGRYPNGGPIRIAAAGIPLIDQAGPAVLEIADGTVITIEGGRVLVDGLEIAAGELLVSSSIEERMEAARGAIGTELANFAANTLEYVQHEARVMFEPLELPPLRTPFKGRHAVVVVRGIDYRTDLRALRPYIREYRPVLIGVDGGADAMLELGLRPDVIIGDFDSVSDRALGSGAELVHHVHPDGRAPGRENLQAWGRPYHELVVEGTSEDAAMLLANDAGASLIVAVGTHSTMVEFLDKGRAGMSSTFLTRLRLSIVLVDAKGVSQLYAGRIRRRDVVLLLAAALVPMVAISVVSEPVHVLWSGVWLNLRDLWISVRDAVSGP